MLMINNPGNLQYLDNRVKYVCVITETVTTARVNQENPFDIRYSCISFVSIFPWNYFQVPFKF